MRTRIIPAQITTIEDKIAGNLSLMQIILLIVSIFISAAIYTLFFPVMKLSATKGIVIVINSIIFFALSVRIKEKIILNWLVLLTRFNVRPKYYIFNKNCHAFRKKRAVKTNKEINKIKDARKTTINITTNHVKDLVKLNESLTSRKVELRFALNKKGGLNVAIEKK